jgi:hypothetical protein
VKQAVAEHDPQFPVTIEPLGEEVARLTERPRFLAWLRLAFAGLALVPTQYSLNFKCRSSKKKSKK